METQKKNPIKKLLIIEDDLSIRELLEELFTSEGYEVIIADHGLHAIDLLADFKPCAILLDLSMAVMDGETFLKEYARKHPMHAEVPVFLMTAAVPSDIPHHRADRILRKPLHIDHLLTTVAKAVATQS